jgi:hypothetical protein
MNVIFTQNLKLCILTYLEGFYYRDEGRWLCAETKTTSLHESCTPNLSGHGIYRAAAQFSLNSDPLLVKAASALKTKKLLTRWRH